MSEETKLPQADEASLRPEDAAAPVSAPVAPTEPAQAPDLASTPEQAAPEKRPTRRLPCSRRQDRSPALTAARLRLPTRTDAVNIAEVN